MNVLFKTPDAHKPESDNEGVHKPKHLYNTSSPAHDTHVSAITIKAS
jgi:hypothetical protein